MKITKHRLREIINEELAESDLGPWRAAFEKVPRAERLSPVESELVKLAAGLKRLGIEDDEVDNLLQPLTTAVEANVEGELGLEERHRNYYPTDYGTDRTRRERTPEEREHDRRERERQNQDYVHRHGKKPFGSRGTHLEEKANQAQQRRDALVSPNAGGLSWRAEDDTMSVGADIEGYPEPEEDEDPMASRLGTREEQLLSRILARAVVDKYDSYEDLANDLGLELDIRMLGWLRSLKANPMYGSSGVEEGKVSSHRSEVTYSKEKRGKSKKPEKKAYNKADRAQAKRDLKK